MVVRLWVRPCTTWPCRLDLWQPFRDLRPVIAAHACLACNRRRDWTLWALGPRQHQSPTRSSMATPTAPPMGRMATRLRDRSAPRAASCDLPAAQRAPAAATTAAAVVPATNSSAAGRQSMCMLPPVSKDQLHGSRLSAGSAAGLARLCLRPTHRCVWAAVEGPQLVQGPRLLCWRHTAGGVPSIARRQLR